ncbi:MAG: 16S rRNA (cytosine(1402)-N(4))-methyltransferase RsmH [Melioribacteraceae bacterium]|nr:16S rRNA (cytosine(1402)-N(4))-methyltransferase RsmH [Melioribacteraceae bacterium]
MEQLHEPVLLEKSLEYLVTNSSGIYFDGTLGFGGHTSGIVSRLNSEGKVIATDKDVDAVRFCKQRFLDEKRISIYRTSFTKIGVLSKLESIDKFDGIFADLGVSSFQLDNISSGFAFRENTPLDMRMNKDNLQTAADVLNSLDEEKLSEIFWRFGEERKSRQIAKRIVEERRRIKFSESDQVKKIVEGLVPANFVAKTMARIFQAVRIYINDELNELEVFLEEAVKFLKQNGRLVLISYHSLEDRIVKNFFKYESLNCICPPDFPVCQCDKEARLKILTKKAVVPEPTEVIKNNRSRSAKLRAAERL